MILPGPRYITPALPIPKNRLAVPDAAAQKKALVLVKDIFKKEFAAGKTATLKIALAKKLLAQGESTSDDVTARFVLMQEARDLTVEAGDSLRAMEIINATAQLYEIDQFLQKRDALRKLARTVRSTPSNSQIIADTAFDTAKSALKFLQFNISQDLVRIASSASSKARNREMTKRISEFRKKMLILKKMHGDAVKAVKTLTTKPEDPAANLARGQFQCFIIQDWTRGLPMLASGTDSRLKETAKRDIAGATNTKQMTALADVWWNLAQKKRGKSFQKTMILVRAKYWYDKAVPDLTGLEKTKIEKRVQEIGELPAILQGIQKNAAPTR